MTQSSNAVVSSTSHRSPRAITASPAAKGSGEFCKSHLVPSGCCWGKRGIQPGSGHQESNRRAEMRIGIIKEFGDERVVVEELLHNAALDALASPVDKTHLSQASGVRGVNVVT